MTSPCLVERNIRLCRERGSCTCHRTGSCSASTDRRSASLTSTSHGHRKSFARSAAAPCRQALCWRLSKYEIWCIGGRAGGNRFRGAPRLTVANARSQRYFSDKCPYDRPPKENCRFAYSMRQFDTGERDGSGLQRLQAQHRGAATFDRAVILLDNVVEIAATANQYRLPSSDLRCPAAVPPDDSRRFRRGSLCVGHVNCS